MAFLTKYFFFLEGKSLVSLWHHSKDDKLIIIMIFSYSVQINNETATNDSNKCNHLLPLVS